MSGNHEPRKNTFYIDVLKALNDSRISYVLGGAYALRRYTGIERYTKDLDVFVKQEDCEKVLDLFSRKGYEARLMFPHWLGKIFHEDEFVDVIFSSGNGLCPVDEDWFRYSVEDKIFDIPVRLSPAEEMIWSKAFIMERERFDGADIAHILNARAEHLNWPRLLERFGRHWRVLFAHLILFGFIYPTKRCKIPSKVMETMAVNLKNELNSDLEAEEYCQGTFLSLQQYLVDVQKWGYQDARLIPWGKMTRKDIDAWTAEFVKEDSA